MREKDAFHFPKRRHGDAVQDVVAIIEQDLSNADQGGVKFVPLQQFRQSRRRHKDYLLLEATRQGDRVEVGDRADAKRSKGLAESVLPLQLDRALFAFEAMGQLLWRF